MSEKSDDLQILKRFNNGEIFVFDELVLKYQERIYNRIDIRRKASGKGGKT